MRRFFLVLLAALFLLSSVAYADAIIEPDNPFYLSHWDECRHGDYRTYVSSVPAGIYSAPGQSQLRTREAGVSFGIEWFYTAKDGSEWGYCERENGWIPMKELEVVYDRISFQEEFADQIELNEELRRFSAFFTGNKAAAYLYPQGPYSGMIEGFSELDTSPIYLYKDPEGRLWGYVGYQYGHIDKWVCLDDPLNEHLSSPDAVQTPKKEYVPDEPLPKTGVSPAVWWGVGAVLIALAAAAVLLIRIARRKKHSIQS
jgi:hypothetical protein